MYDKYELDGRNRRASDWYLLSYRNNDRRSHRRLSEGDWLFTVANAVLNPDPETKDHKPTKDETDNGKETI